MLRPSLDTKQIIMRLKYNQYITTSPLDGFYGSVIPAGTILYPCYMSDRAIKNSDGEYYSRFVFDTVKGSKYHNADGNIRYADFCDKRQAFTGLRGLSNREFRALQK